MLGYAEFGYLTHCKFAIEQNLDQANQIADKFPQDVDNLNRDRTRTYNYHNRIFKGLIALYNSKIIATQGDQLCQSEEKHTLI